MMQERLPSPSRKPTARSSGPRSAHIARTASALAAPGFIVTIRKIAARVSGATTGCGVTVVVIAPTAVV